ncbi:hypothetical protein GGR10_000563 [Bartonella chomelii]|uniref:Uncharacterized protein n=1 Tax=Bartonella chomelii TaxID=236402 RepID=A0ABR6E2E5_9HYPH|nr:hypothetical protein [Bartonella chomelii]
MLMHMSQKSSTPCDLPPPSSCSLYLTDKSSLAPLINKPPH